MRFLVALLVSLVALLSVGCTERPRCEAYHFHRTYPAAYQASAREAAAKWTAFSGRPVAIVDGDPDDLECAMGSVGDSSTPEYHGVRLDMDGQDYFAAHMDNQGTIWLAEGEWTKSPDFHNRPAADFATSILMHELAHEYGLSHVENGPDAIMGVLYPGTNLEYNSQDRAELIRVTE